MDDATVHCRTGTHAFMCRASGNKFSHMSFEQFRNTLLMQNHSTSSPSVASILQASVESSKEVGSHRHLLGQVFNATDRNVNSVNNGTDVDWVAAGTVTPVRDQGLQCGESTLSCVKHEI